MPESKTRSKESKTRSKESKSSHESKTVNNVAASAMRNADGSDAYVMSEQESNRRVGTMNAKEEAQCILDIKSWYDDNVPDLASIKGANSADIKALLALDGDKCTVPPILVRLLEAFDGGVWVYEHRILSAHDALEAQKESSDGLPIAQDLDEDYLFVRPKDGALVSAGSKEADSLSEWLEGFRNKLIGRRLEYVEDCGFTEVEASAPKAKNGK
jgi:hypothetical protein